MLLHTVFSFLLLLALGFHPQPVHGATRELTTLTTLAKPSRYSHTITGRVVGVADGDTITVLDAENTQHKIRFMGIDAPEKSMPFGQRSKQNLSNLIFGKVVLVEVRAMDRYKREVGRIVLGGRDINLAQVESGMAWVYRQYLKELTRSEARSYLGAELEAKTANRGLWADPEPIPPWEWRKAKKGKKPFYFRPRHNSAW